MNKRKFFLLPICLLLLGACNLNQPESKESKKVSEPEVSEPETSSVEEQTSSECEHEFGEWTVSMIATCTEKGEETRVCSKCGASEKRETNELGHDWDDGVVKTIPTVDAKGSKLFTCNRCKITKTEEIEKAKGINVTFTEGQHFEVWVYKTKAYTTEQPVKTNTCYARDENGNAIDFDANADLQPQVNFQVICDEGYSVGVSNVKVTGAEYKNIKQGPNSADGLPDETYFRITKIQGDIQVTITPINGEQKVPEAKIIANHCQVVVYKTKTISDENIDTAETINPRDDNGEVAMAGGQINFKVIPEAGYVWNHGAGATGDEVGANTLPFIALSEAGAAKNFKVIDAENNIFRITKVNGDISLLVNCVPAGGEADLGYEVTFVTEHCSVFVYQTQDYEFTPVAPTDNKALTRTDDGSAAKYVAKDEAAGIAEVKPQINFKIVCEDGYTVGEANISITGTYKNLKIDPEGTGDSDIIRITVIKSNLTITITAVAAA